MNFVDLGTNVDELNTVEKIAKHTKKIVREYRQDEEKKSTAIAELTPLFSSEAKGWKLVIDMGKFRNGFTRVQGKRGMKALKVLLHELDKKKYQKINFEDE